LAHSIYLIEKFIVKYFHDTISLFYTVNLSMYRPRLTVYEVAQHRHNVHNATDDPAAWCVSLKLAKTVKRIVVLGRRLLEAQVAHCMRIGLLGGGPDL